MSQRKVWAWLKKYWVWLLFFPIALLAYLWGRRNPPSVLPPRESSGAEEFLRQLEETKVRKLRELDEDKRAQVEAVLENHEEEMKGLTEAQWEEAQGLLQDPAALNTYLLEVGKRAREGKV